MWRITYKTLHKKGLALNDAPNKIAVDELVFSIMESLFKGLNMKQIAILLFILLLTPFQSKADADTRAAIEKMFELTDMQAMLDSSYAQMDAMFAQMAPTQNMNAKQRAIFDSYITKFTKATREIMSWEEMKEPIIDAYAQVYTRQEIEELIAFYEAPIGKKMLQKMPELIQATMQTMQGFSQKVLPKMRQLQEELQAELKAVRD